jgi:hypothetical protein
VRGQAVPQGDMLAGGGPQPKPVGPSHAAFHPAPAMTLRIYPAGTTYTVTSRAYGPDRDALRLQPPDPSES